MYRHYSSVGCRGSFRLVCGEAVSGGFCAAIMYLIVHPHASFASYPKQNATIPPAPTEASCACGLACIACSAGRLRISYCFEPAVLIVSSMVLAHLARQYYQICKFCWGQMQREEGQTGCEATRSRISIYYSPSHQAHQ